MPTRILLCLLLAGLLVGCTSPRGDMTDEERRTLQQSLAPSRSYKVGSVTYLVSRRPEAFTGIRVRTRGGVDGTSRGAFTAAKRAYGCQSIRLTETIPVWRVSEGHGTLCEFDRSGGVNR